LEIYFLNYHAHIYWANLTEKELALSFRLTLHDNGCGLGRIKDKPVGPHPRPMYQVVYDAANQEFVESYLSQHHGEMSILLHEDIGHDHKRDHTDGARWIGEELTLNLASFG
jgi:aromatic ring-cleaving dioxygenase